jgi:hypothetical protein
MIARRLNFGETSSGRDRTKDWIKVKNPDAPAATRVIEG